MADIQSTLDLIDDTVEQKCACGCGVKLDPDGPSQWYATPDCQWRFQQQHAHDPGDVYDRPDAVDVWVGADAMPVPLVDRVFGHSGRQRGPLRRLASGPLRHPLSEGRRPDDYWPHEQADPDRVRGVTPTRMWLDGVEITDYVSSIDLNPIIEDTSFGDTDWRETLSGLRSGSMTLTGFHDHIPPHTHWQLWPNEPEPTSTYSADLASAVEEWIAANPTLPPLEPFQREFLDRAYTSPLVPQDQVVIVSAEMMESLDWSGRNALTRITAGSEYDFQRDRYNLRIAATSELEAHRRVQSILSDSTRREATRREAAQALAILERNRRLDAEKAARKVRLAKFHKAYRSRQLSRRRRGR